MLKLTDLAIAVAPLNDTRLAPSTTRASPPQQRASPPRSPAPSEAPSLPPSLPPSPSSSPFASLLIVDDDVLSIVEQPPPHADLSPESTADYTDRHVLVFWGEAGLAGAVVSSPHACLLRTRHLPLVASATTSTCSIQARASTRMPCCTPTTAHNSMRPKHSRGACWSDPSIITHTRRLGPTPCG